MSALRYAALDLETHLVQEGLLAPPVVCASVAREGAPGRLIAPGETRAEKAAGAVAAARELLLDDGVVLVGANIPYDFGCLCAESPDLLPLVFAAYAAGRVHDVQVAQALHAVAAGDHGRDPRTGRELKGRYSLQLCVELVLGRADAKARDRWRLMYALLGDVPAEDWPEEARLYPVDDAVNTLEVALMQLRGGGAGPTPGPHLNLGDLAAQCESHWAMHLGAAWGLRVDGERARELRRRVEVDHADFMRRHSRFFRAGKFDRQAAKRAVAVAYSAGSAPCSACAGVGKVLSLKTGNPVFCKACSGTGLELEPSVPRTPSGGVQTDKDALTESGDPDLASLADNEPEKIRDTYLPWLEQGSASALCLRPNPLVASGRTSYDGLVQLIPREGGVRECFRARGAWCGHSEETSYLSVDYAAIELVALAQVCLWTVGWSRMAEVIRESGDPGALHTAFGARLAGRSYEEMAAAVRAGDKVAKNYRWAAKACFHPDVEALTRRGWVRVADLTMEDEVASIDPSKYVGVDGSKVEMKCGHCYTTYLVKRSKLRKSERSGVRSGRFCSKACANAHRGLPLPGLKVLDKKPAEMRVVWTRPLRLTRRRAEDGLVWLKNEGVDLRVTPDHNMLEYGATNELARTAAAEFGEKRGWFNAGTWDGGDWEPDERLLRLAVATQADGSFAERQIRFGFTKARKIERLRELLCEGEYRETTSDAGVTSFTVIGETAANVCALLDDEKQFTWRWLGLTAARRAAVLDEVYRWDGSEHESWRAVRYCSTGNQNVDVVQAIAAVSGRKTRLSWVDSHAEGHKSLARLTIRDKGDTRGDGTLSRDRLQYDGDVFCLTVPSGYLIVRDGGIPICLGQCNFGSPGGMGSAKFVLTQRKKNAGSTTTPDGEVTYPGLRFCVLLDGARRCGEERVSEWKGRDVPALCRRCLEIVDGELRPSWFREWPEIREYHKWVSAQVDAGEPARCLVPDGEGGSVAARVRGGVDFTNYANQGFQGLAADGGKAALRAVTRECYLGRRVEVRGLSLVETREPSPLLGARVPFFLHDELFLEVPRAREAVAARRAVELMEEVMQEYTPDVPVRAEPALSLRWSKAASGRWSASGELVPWDLCPGGCGGPVEAEPARGQKLARASHASPLCTWFRGLSAADVAEALRAERARR